MEVEDTLPVPRLVRKNTSVTTPGLPKEIYATKLQEMLGLDDIRDLNLTEVQNSGKRPYVFSDATRSSRRIVQ